MGTLFGLKEGTLWGLANAFFFALHLVRSELRQKEAEDIAQLAAGQMVVLGAFSLMLLPIAGVMNPQVLPELNLQVVLQACS
jgi:di/tricarboxylate transporter